jgi:hypothetical protein
MLFLTMLVTLVTACSKDGEMEYLVAGNEYKYWISTDTTKSDRVFYFDRKGTFLVFFIHYYTKKFYMIKHDDLVYSNTWKLVNDSIVELDKQHGIILALTPKLFATKSESGLLILVAAPDSIIPKEFQKIQKIDNVSN